MATELRVDSDRPESEQIKIVVMALQDDDKNDLVEWAIEVCAWSVFCVVSYIAFVKVAALNSSHIAHHFSYFLRY